MEETDHFLKEEKSLEEEIEEDSVETSENSNGDVSTETDPGDSQEPSSDTKNPVPEEPSKDQEASKEKKKKDKRDESLESADQKKDSIQTDQPVDGSAGQQSTETQNSVDQPDAADIDIDNELMQQLNNVTADQTQPQETILTEDTVLEQTDSQVHSVSGQAFYRLPTKPDQLFLNNGLPNANSGYFAPYFYYQYDEEFRNQVAADGTQDASSSGAFSHRGCGPTTMANVVSVLTGNRISPTDVATAAEQSPVRPFTYAGGDTGYKIVTWACENYGLECKGLGTDMGAVKQYLKDGYLVVVVGAGTLCASGTTTGSAHYGYCYSYNEANDSTIFVGQANLMAPSSPRYRNQQYVSMAELQEAIGARAGAGNGGPAWAITGYADDYEGSTAEELGAYTGCSFQAANKMNATAQVCYGCWKVAEEDGTILIPAITKTEDGFLYHFSEDGTSAIITGYCGKKKNITVPSKINEKPVSVITGEAFKENHDITKVTVSEGITKIRKEAFASCAALKMVTLPSTLKKLDSKVFAESCNLESVGYLSNNLKMKKDSFESCSEQLVIFCYPGSQAEQIAEQNGIAYSYAISPLKNITSIHSNVWKKGRILLEWKEDMYADGYEIAYSEDKEFEGVVHYFHIEEARTLIDGLETGKTYYFRIRSYTQSGIQKVYGNFSLPYEITAK